MPTKRRFIIFLIVLAFMLLVKYAAAQQAAGWKLNDDWLLASPTAYILGVMGYSIFFGLIAGALRTCTRNEAARRGHYFTGDLVTIRISS